MAALTFGNLNLPFFIFFIAVVLPSACSVYFKMQRFDSNEQNILYQGDAVPSVGAIELNNRYTYICRVGWATYAETVPLWDSQTGKLSDFTTQFSFSIDTLTATPYGHGLTFFLAPVGFQIPPNSVCGFLGLFNATTAHLPSNHIVMVEFDSFSNPEWDPPDVKDHVGINNNSIASAVYTRWNASFHSGDTADARITYNATTKNLSVSWTYRQTSNSLENSSLFYMIDLMQVLPEWVTIGFSAASGENGQRHILQAWEFNSNLDIEKTKRKNAKPKRTIILATISFSFIIIGLITGLIILLRRRKLMRRNRTETRNLSSINIDLGRDAGPRRFSYRELASATNNFSDNRKLGEGGFGAVYRGYLIDIDMVVAVKRISRGSKQGRKEYVTEVKIISQLRHRNLVHLIGWCHDRGEFSLVYEFMPNGSLDSHLFGNKRPLIWPLRYRISLGLASALLYLHEEWEQCIVHRDIKSSNIMLDSNFNVKLGDFGLARLMDHELGLQSTTGLAGTLGYLAPEYISTGRASKESDVFSFGIVVLEMTSGRKSVDPIKEKSEIGLIEWIWDLYGRGKLLLGVDEKLHMDFDERQVECLIAVGLWCAHPDYTLRPSIRQAIQVLTFEAPLPNLPTKMPIPIYTVPKAHITSSEPSISASSLDVGR